MGKFWLDFLMMMLPIGLSFWMFWTIANKLDRMDEEMNGLRRWCDLLEKQIKMQREKSIPATKKKK